jgi:oxalate decarboxylase/phosphoglucose isomerase-like protein (cupin superfamily)
MHDETFLVINGTLRFAVGDTYNDLHTGDYVVVPTMAYHTFSNPFEETAVFFNSFTPAYYVNYLRDLAAIYKEGDLSSEAIRRVMARYATEASARSN